MVLQLRSNDFLRLSRAAGTLIEVLSGRVWVTEQGRARDSLLGPGRRYRVCGNDLVLVGTETYAGDGPGAEIELKGNVPMGTTRGVWKLVQAFAAEIQARRTRRELEGLSDHILRDIGLRRDQIDSIGRKSRPL